MSRILSRVLVTLACCTGLSLSQCAGSPKVIWNGSETILLRNVGTENGKAVSCSWKFKMKNRQPFALVLKLSTPKPSTWRILGRRLCPFSINGNRVNYNSMLSLGPKDRVLCRAFYNSGICAGFEEVNSCMTAKLTNHDVNLTYFSEGSSFSGNNFKRRFKMEYNFVFCRKPGNPQRAIATTGNSPNTIPVTTIEGNSNNGNPLHTSSPGRNISDINSLATDSNTSDAESTCLLRGVPATLLAGIIGAGIGAGAAFLLVKHRFKSVISVSTGVTGSSTRPQTFPNTGFSGYVDMQGLSTGENIYADASQPPSALEGPYEVPLPSGHYEEAISSGKHNGLSSNAYELELDGR